MIIHLQVTESEARQLIAGVQDRNPELARVLRRNVDRQTGQEYPGRRFTDPPFTIPND